jgi:hypothetical protein
VSNRSEKNDKKSRVWVMIRYSSNLSRHSHESEVVRGGAQNWQCIKDEVGQPGTEEELKDVQSDGILRKEGLLSEGDHCDKGHKVDD